ncbi:hypothetical protein [Paenibacillus tundrae]
MKTTRSLPRTITIAAALTLTLTGCATQASTSSPAPVATDTATKTEEQNHVLSSAQNEVEITVPLDWNTFPQPGSPILLSAMEKNGEGILMIQRDNREDRTESSLEEIVENWDDEFSSADGGTYESKRTGSMTIDSAEAYLTEGTMALPVMTGNFLSASLEKENHYYHLYFIRQRELNDNDREFFTQLAQSMRILNDQPAVVETEPTSGSTKVIKSEDGKTSIRIPADWESDFRIIIDAKLEATSLSGEEYFISLQSPKSWSDPGITLEEYVDDYIERQTEFSDDITKPDKVAVEIDGRPGFQFEILSTMDNVNHIYMYTILDYPDHFAIISFSATENLFMESKQTYLESTESYGEEQ